jgi:hypothetical protein
MPFPLSAVDLVVRTNWSDLLEVMPCLAALLMTHLLHCLPGGRC